ncbi:MAG: 4Fe-4S binding protein [Collinsella sp.]
MRNYAREEAEPFRECVETFTEEQVRAETARCLGCGASIVDENKCIGCGLCTTKCAFDAIHLHREHPECSTMVKYEKKIPSLGEVRAQARDQDPLRNKGIGK